MSDEEAEHPEIISTTLQVDRRERGTMLAVLRLYQHVHLERREYGSDQRYWMNLISAEDGKPLTGADIDNLIERLNRGG